MKLLSKKKIQYEDVLVLKPDEYDQIMEFAHKNLEGGEKLTGIESVQIHFSQKDLGYTKNYLVNVRRGFNNNKIRR